MAEVIKNDKKRYTDLNMEERYVAIQDLKNYKDTETEKTASQKAAEYIMISKGIESLTEQQVKVDKIRISLEMLDATVERVPQGSLQIAFIFACLEYPRLKLVLPRFEQFEDIFGEGTEILFFSMITGITIWSITKALLNFK